MERIVYVVDDDEPVRESTCALLEAEGISAKPYATAKAFLSEFDTRKAGCIILDVHMKEMSGLELLSLLRARGVTTPALIFTGRRDLIIDELAKRAGALAMLDKPLHDDELVKLVKTALAS